MSDQSRKVSDLIKTLFVEIHKLQHEPASAARHAGYIDAELAMGSIESKIEVARLEREKIDPLYTAAQDVRVAHVAKAKAKA